MSNLIERLRSCSSASESQQDRDCAEAADTLEALNKVYLAAKGGCGAHICKRGPRGGMKNNGPCRCLRRIDAAIEELEAKGE